MGIVTLLAYAVFLFGLYIALITWFTVIRSFYRYKVYSIEEHYSLTPFVGGVLMAFTWYVIPYKPLHSYWYLAFIIDFNSVPWLFLMGIYCFKKILIKNH